MPAQKGQKFKHYSEEPKLHAIQMRLKGVSKRHAAKGWRPNQHV